MPQYQVTIEFSHSPVATDQHHASMAEAREAATREALSHLLSVKTNESRRAAVVWIVERHSNAEARFEVALELTDYI